ncbi:MAG: hypothetical protein ACI83O_000163 [Patescibacteria group bacterium]|jgi:hypothetical protein
MQKEKNKQAKKPKVLKLKPAHKDKRRYLLINEKSNKKIEETILKYVGILGHAKAAYMKVYAKDFKSKTVASVLNSQLIKIQTAFTLEGIKIEKVASTLKGLSK